MRLLSREPFLFGMNDEEIRKAFEAYRKLKRQHYFMVKASIEKQKKLRMAGAGDPAPALKPAVDAARSSGVALPPLLDEPRGEVHHTGSASAMPHGDGINQFSHKATPERDDDNKGRTDYPSSSSGSRLTDGH